ncbi:MAG TPA: thioredoxin-like domain-containing protein [Aggregatilineaceae bacterium]|nr:thioredoxin-like domain-containing protein [Aggregatilineaceae bacterium]
MKRLNLVATVLLTGGLVGVLALSASGAVAQDGGTPKPTGSGSVTYTWAGTVNAPDFPRSEDWINVSQPLTIADLRGKIVLLDFWTYGCINCIHVIPDLKRLESEYPTQLVVIGIHSAKFANEGETQNIRYIVERYEITHPVLNDNQFIVWQEYGAQAWPTFMVIDPFGKVVGQLAGEPLYDRIAPVIATMAKEYGAAGALNPAPLPQLKPELASMEDTPLRFPGKVLVDPPGNRLFISDSNHNRIVVTTLDTYDVQDVIGSGEEGLQDGDFQTAQFFRPQGLALVGNSLYVADTENQAIRAVDLSARMVTTVAGTGKQGFNYDNSGPGLQMDLSSPWDLVAYNGKVYIAMAGTHQIWVYDIASGEIGPYAGSGREALVDGKLREAGMNQPSGIDSDGSELYFTDPEASAVRIADLNPEGEVKTIVGTGLFDFGDVDGIGDTVRLQHPLGITVAADGYLYIADTYNSKIKRIDPTTGESVTYLGTGQEGLADGSDAQFYEPGGIDYADGRLYIADTNNNAIRVVNMANRTVSTVQFPNVERLLETQTPAISVPDGILSPGEPVVTLPVQTVGAGEGTILVNVTMPQGYKFNDIAPFTATWSESPLAQIPEASRNIRIVDPQMPLEVPVTLTAGQTSVAVDLTVYWCEAVNETLCFVDRVRLEAPLTVSAEGSNHTVTMEYGLVPPAVQDTFG